MSRPIAFSVALEYVAEAEMLSDTLERLYRDSPHDRAAIGKANARLGVVLKLADTQATLSITEALGALADDLASLIDDDPMPASLPVRVLTAVRDLEPDAGAVHAHLCEARDDVLSDGVCGREAVVFPPPRCALHGGLEDAR